MMNSLAWFLIGLGSAAIVLGVVAGLDYLFPVDKGEELDTKPVGSTFWASDGTCYQVVESDPTCTGCDMNMKDCIRENHGYCTASRRTDGTEVIFKRIK